MARLIETYQKNVAPALKKEFEFKNVHQIPKITKVVINVGVGRANTDSKYLEAAASTLRIISGQAPVTTVARTSIAGFKLREGQKIGVSVTLRGERMYEFLDRLVSIVLPRIRDFRGINPGAFDKNGNYSLGITDQSIFPEIPFEEANITHSLQVNIVTTAKSPAEGQRLLALLGFPFKRSE